MVIIGTFDTVRKTSMLNHPVGKEMIDSYQHDLH